MRKWLYVAVALSLALSAPGIGAEKSGTEGRFLKLADKSFVPLGQGSWFPGLIVGISHDGVRQFRSYGFNRLKPQRPLDASAVGEMGSVGKVFTGLLALELVQEKKLDLEAPVEQYLPGGLKLPAKDGKKITIRNLLEHRSGLAMFNVPSLPEEKAMPPEQRFLARLARVPLASTPGKTYEYSSLGYDLLGYACELASGQSYEELLRARICDPLGMPDTSTRWTAKLLKRAVQGHGDDGAEVKPFGPYDPSKHQMYLGGGGTFSTVNDMLTFAEAIYQGKLPELKRAVEAYQKLNIGSGGEPPIHGIRHGGQILGSFSADFVVDQDQNAGMIMLANVSSYPIITAADKFFDAKPWAAEDSVKTIAPAKDPDQAQNQAMAGLYAQEKDQDFWYLAYDGSGLSLTAPWTSEWGKQKMWAMGKGAYKVKGWNSSYQFDPKKEPITLTGVEEGKPTKNLTRVAAAYPGSEKASLDDLDGVWEGDVPLKGKPEKMLVKMEKTEGGALIAKFPAGGYFGYKIDYVGFERGVVDIETSKHGGMFVGQLGDADSLSGYWCQAGVYPVTLKRLKKAPKIKWYEFKPPVVQAAK